MTGTNGKTTVTQLLGRVLDRRRRRTAVIGTLDGPRTTPEAATCSAGWPPGSRRGSTRSCMEVSSHAPGPAPGRRDRLRRSASSPTSAVTTSTSTATMEAYFEAKAKLFEPVRTERRRGVPRRPVRCPAARRPRRGMPAALAPRRLRARRRDRRGPDASAARASRWRGQRVHARWSGASTSRTRSPRRPPPSSSASRHGRRRRGPAGPEPVAGPLRARRRPVSPPAVVVDYAHTPDGARDGCSPRPRARPGRGSSSCSACGGDRDPGSDRRWARSPAAAADVVVVTVRQPAVRGSRPRSSRRSSRARAGPRPHGELVVEPDRRAAIALAVRRAAARRRRRRRRQGPRDDPDRRRRRAARSTTASWSREELARRGRPWAAPRDRPRSSPARRRRCSSRSSARRSSSPWLRGATASASPSARTGPGPPHQGGHADDGRGRHRGRRRRRLRRRPTCRAGVIFTRGGTARHARSSSAPASSGLLDDWIKVRRERNLGLNKRAKIVGLLVGRRRSSPCSRSSGPTCTTTLSFTRFDSLELDLGDRGAGRCGPCS